MAEEPEEVLPEQRITPRTDVKKLVPKSRSNVSSTRATAITGMANSRRKFTTSVIHVNTGMRMKLIPGARILMMVTIRLTALVSDAMPRIWMPMT